MDRTIEIRCVLLRDGNTQLLLPGTVIADVLSATPEPIPGAPDWLLGHIRWRGWQLPLVSFARMSGIAEQGGPGGKVVVLKALGGDPHAPYFALLAQECPRLIAVTRERLVADAGQCKLPIGVLVTVTLNEDVAVVPDLAHIERMIAETLLSAAT